VESLDELQADNRRLRHELAELRARVRAIEASRWHRLHPRFLWRRHVRMPAPTDAATRKEIADVAPEAGRGDARLERFREEVLARGTFTHVWAVGDVPAWEPLLHSLEGRDADLLEIGSFEGLSACYLMWRLPDARITCIDTFTGSTEHRGTDVDARMLEATFDANVALVDATRVRKLVGESRRRLLDLIAEQARFDLVYVDGSHLGLDVVVDASLSWQVLKAGGVLVFDDYPWAELGEDPLLRPGPAIDAFLELVEGKYEPLFADYQIAIRKAG